jgi:hypothetical protein
LTLERLHSWWTGNATDGHAFWRKTEAGKRNKKIVTEINLNQVE